MCILPVWWCSVILHRKPRVRCNIFNHSVVGVFWGHSYPGMNSGVMEVGYSSMALTGISNIQQGIISRNSKWVYLLVKFNSPDVHVYLMITISHWSLIIDRWTLITEFYLSKICTLPSLVYLCYNLYVKLRINHLGGQESSACIF